MSLSAIEARLRSIGIDRYLLALFATLLLATLFPARGVAAAILSSVTFWAVAALFFMYGARLSTASIREGLLNWKLQGGTLIATFVMFPLLALMLSPLTALFPAAIGVGILFIGSLPSTVQSSIAFTSISRGNVPGAICAASLSNILGVFLSPAIIALLLATSGDADIGLSAIWRIAQQILLPFVLGQLCRPWLAASLLRRPKITRLFDQATILLIVYSAFSAGVLAGIWQIMGLTSLIALVLLVLLFLGLAMGMLALMARFAAMPRADSLALFYCGSTKSLATGLPMAGILFVGQDVALIVLPLMLFHLFQLVACAMISSHIATKSPKEADDQLSV